jgi:hypothetical protein
LQVVMLFFPPRSVLVFYRVRNSAMKLDDVSLTNHT